jgi:fluoride ion exporter CrcB/FEX
MEIQQKENDSARQREVQIATSDKAPVLNKIISPLLALLILGSTFLFWYFILFKDLNKEKEMLVSGIVGSLTTLSMGVVSYYFGSSIGSHQKQERLDKLIK